MKIAALLLLLPALAAAQTGGLDRAAASARAAVHEPDPRAAVALAGETLDGGAGVPTTIAVPAGSGRKPLPRYSTVLTDRAGELPPPAPAAAPGGRPSRLKALGLALWSPVEAPLTMMVAYGIWGAAKGYSLLPVPVLRSAGVFAGGLLGGAAGLVLGAVLGLAGFIPKLVKAVTRGR